MEQFLLNFHHFPIPQGVTPSAKEFEAVNKQWQSYIGGIAGQGVFIGTQRLGQTGSIVHPGGAVTNAINDGQELIVGTLTLKANNLEEAIELAKGCPILNMGGSVEVRPVLDFDL